MRSSFKQVQSLSVLDYLAENIEVRQSAEIDLARFVEQVAQHRWQPGSCRALIGALE